MANKWGNNDDNGRLHFLGSKITADGDCSLEIKRYLFLERKAMTNLDSLLKSRDIILLVKVHIVKAMVFPAVMHGCESWAIKKVECQDASELWCWRRLMRVQYSLERLMWELKLQYFGHLMQRVDLLEKTLMLGKIEDRKGRGRQRIRWLEDITESMDMFEQTQGDNEDRRAWCTAVHGVTKRWTWPSQRTANTNKARGPPVSDIRLSDYALPPNKAPEVDTISVKDCFNLVLQWEFCWWTKFHTWKNTHLLSHPDWPSHKPSIKGYLPGLGTRAPPLCFALLFKDRNSMLSTCYRFQKQSESKHEKSSCVNQVVGNEVNWNALKLRVSTASLQAVYLLTKACPPPPQRFLWFPLRNHSSDGAVTVHSWRKGQLDLWQVSTESIQKSMPCTHVLPISIIMNFILLSRQISGNVIQRI